MFLEPLFLQFILYLGQFVVTSGTGCDGSVQEYVYVSLQICFPFVHVNLCSNVLWYINENSGCHSSEEPSFPALNYHMPYLAIKRDCNGSWFVTVPPDLNCVCCIHFSGHAG